MKLEAISPDDHTTLYPATVIKVFDDIYFLVHIDDYEDSAEKKEDETPKYDITDKNTAYHPYIFPIGWAKKNNIRYHFKQLYLGLGDHFM